MVYINSFLWLESETHIDFLCRPQSHSKFRFIDECFHFHFFFVRLSFERVQNILQFSICATRISSVNACLCAHFYSCMFVRVITRIFVLFYFVISFLFESGSLSLSLCAMAPRDYSIFIHIVTYSIYRIILARLHTCINKRIPNIHVNGFGYALLMSVFACISFSLSLEVAKKTWAEWFSEKNWLFFVLNNIPCSSVQ